MAVALVSSFRVWGRERLVPSLRWNSQRVFKTSYLRVAVALVSSSRVWGRERLVPSLRLNSQTSVYTGIQWEIFLSNPY